MNSATTSRILVVGPKVESLNYLGAQYTSDFSKADQLVAENPPAVVVLSLEKSSHKQLLKFSSNLSQISPSTQKVLLVTDEMAAQVAEVINTGQVSQALFVDDLQSLPKAVEVAAESFDQEIQDRDLIELVNEQNRKLQNLSKTLSERIKRREQYLKRTQKNLTNINRKVEALHAALVAVHKANSIGEMEGLLNESLCRTLDLSWTRVLFKSQSHIEEQLKTSNVYAVYSVDLTLNGLDSGTINFARDATRNFTKDDKEFLDQISEGITLAIDRIMKLEEAEHLKQQWESTFDSISEPIALTDQNYKIIRTNKSFSEASGHALPELIGKEAFTSILGENDQRPTTTDKHQSFHLVTKCTRDEQVLTYDISGQLIAEDNSLLDETEAPVYLLFFRDITKQQQLERQILESAKMAELGTIGSSIAHELNNPLGGIISFLQLIRMDLPKDSPHRDDILEMSEAGQRCKEIVENLLGFSRPHDSEANTEIDLREVISQGLKITELQTRSKSVVVKVNMPKTKVNVWGSFALLSQAIRNILQNAYEAMEKKLLSDINFTGRIDVTLKENKKRVILTVSDNTNNFSGLETAALESQRAKVSLGLTIAYKIISEHQGELEIFSQPKIGSTARISLKRLDLSGDRQVFDSKI